MSSFDKNWNGRIRVFAIIVKWFGFYNILCIPLKEDRNPNFFFANGQGLFYFVRDSVYKLTLQFY